MKKKLLTILALCVFCLSFLTGCNLIETDTKLDLAQVVATVGDEEYKDEITKSDLLSVVLSQGSSYIQQGMSVEDVVNGFFDVLVQRRILVQEAVKAIIADKKLDTTLAEVLTEKDGSKVSEQMKPLLKQEGVSGDNMIWRLYNTAYNAALEAEESQIKTSIDKYKLEDDEDYVAPSTEEKTKRPVRTDADEDQPVAKKEFKYRNAAGDKYGESVEDGTEYDSTEKGYIKRAYKDYVSAIESNDFFDEGKSWDYYINSYFERMLVEQLEAQLIEVHTELLEKQLMNEIGSADKSDAEIKESEIFKELEQRYTSLQTAQGQQFEANIDANITQIEGLSDTTYLLYNAAKGQYGFVRHILFKFNDVQTMKLNEIKAQDLNDKAKEDARNELAQKITVKDLREENEETGFTPTGDKWGSVDEFMTFFNTAFTGVPVGDNTYDKPIYRATSIPNYISTSEIPDENPRTETEDIALIKDKFIDYEYAYSDDTASLGSSTNMLLNQFTDPFLSNQKYVTEFSEASRNVINTGIGTYTTVVTDYGIHLILCADLIKPESNPTTGYQFNEDLAVKVIKGENLTDDDKNSAIYKIFAVLKNEKVSADNTEYNVQIVKDYEKADKIYRNTELMNELLKQVRS